MGQRALGNTPTANATSACLAALALATSGCSFMFSEGAPQNHRSLATLSCGDSRSPPIADTIASGVAVLGALSAAQDQKVLPHDRQVAVGVFAAFAAIGVSSAIYGYSTAASCRDAEASRADEIARARLLPAPYGVPPYGEPPPWWPPPLAAAAPPPPPPAAPEPAAPAVTAPAPPPSP